MKQKQLKTNMVGVKLTDQQVQLLDRMVAEGTVKNRSAAIQLLINQKIILG